MQGASHGAGAGAGGLGPRNQEHREPWDSRERTIAQLFGISLSEGKSRGQAGAGAEDYVNKLFHSLKKKWVVEQTYV